MTRTMLLSLTLVFAGVGLPGAHLTVSATQQQQPQQQQPQQQEPHPQAGPHQHPRAAGKPTADMMARCKSVMADRAKMMEEAKAGDAKLDELVTKMNDASGDAKIDATAAVVSEMVAQRKAMRSRMMAMQQEMMSHMMEHMQAGPGSMANCPVMKEGMGGMKP